MTKDEAKLKLRKEGYNVVDDNSVVTVLIAEDVSVSKTVKDVEAKLKALGYEASFAVKQVADGSTIQTEESDDTDEAALDEAVDTEQDAETEADPDEAAAAGEVSMTKASDKTGGADDSDDSDSDDTGYLDDEDSDMLLTEDAVQFSLDDFGLDF